MKIFHRIEPRNCPYLTPTEILLSTPVTIKNCFLIKPRTADNHCGLWTKILVTPIYVTVSEEKLNLLNPMCLSKSSSTVIQSNIFACFIVLSFENVYLCAKHTLSKIVRYEGMDTSMQIEFSYVRSAVNVRNTKEACIRKSFSLR